MEQNRGHRSCGQTNLTSGTTLGGRSQWKIWLMNEAESEAGGIYVFDDEASLQAHLEGPLAGAVKAHPALSDMSAKVFDSIEKLTAITRGPIGIGRSV